MEIQDQNTNGRDVILVEAHRLMWPLTGCIRGGLGEIILRLHNTPFQNSKFMNQWKNQLLSRENMQIRQKFEKPLM